MNCFRSIVILDNAKIHMYRELEQLIHSRGSLLFFLPPYSPHLNHIEVGFSLLKRWITRHAPFAFRHDTARTIAVELVECTKSSANVGRNLYSHCGYDLHELNRLSFVIDESV